MSVRTRIAPAPTGSLHIGTARTALFNYLFAKKQGGKFVLRIEDTDLERSDPKYEKDIREGLHWLGIAPDEDPEKGGPYGPYRQSERLDTYAKELKRLLADGYAFYCPHSETELEAERKSLLASGKPPLHVCAERDWRRGPPAGGGIIRFRTPDNQIVEFTDVIRGKIRFASRLIGDFALAKDLKTPLYNFAVVVDDHAMQISHVIRGEDHISNTPKQILIQEALSLEKPAYAHLPLILGPDRSKLSKRHGATSIREFREEGYFPEALVNFMALLGWNPGDERELFSMEELVREFDLANVQKSGAIFNIEKLDWVNAEHMKRKPIEELRKMVEEEGYVPGFSVSDIESTLRVERTRLKRLSELRAPEKKYMRQPAEYEAALLGWKSMTGGEIKESLTKVKEIVVGISDAEFSAEGLQERFLKEIGGGDKGTLLWPLRVALTGLRESPGPFEIMAELGKRKSLARVEAALKKISA